MKKPISLIFFVLAFTSLTAAGSHIKRRIFSEQIVSDGTGARMPNDTSIGNGLFLYEIDNGLIVGEYHSGKSIEVIGSGPEYSIKVRRAFAAASLSNFNFEQVLSEVKKVKGSENSAHIYSARTGSAVHRIFANFEGTSFDFECEHIGTDLREYSKSNANLERLQALFDTLEVSF
jgi:hypothetical protein